MKYPMPIRLDHVVVLARDNRRSADHFAQIVGTKRDAPAGAEDDFQTVRIDAGLRLFFMTADQTANQHLAFVVNDSKFDEILGQLNQLGVPFGNAPDQTENRQTDHPFAPRGIFWTDANGILYEIMTE